MFTQARQVPSICICDTLYIMRMPGKQHVMNRMAMTAILVHNMETSAHAWML